MKGHVHADQSSSSSGNKAKSSNYNLRNEDVEEINRRVFYRHLGQDLQDLHELFVTLNQQLVKDAEIHENVVRSYSQHASSSLSDLTRHLTKEDIWIHTITTDTRKVSLDFVRNLLDIQVNQKKTYEAQLKRLREVCNQATRNAMQVTFSKQPFYNVK